MADSEATVAPLCECAFCKRYVLDADVVDDPREPPVLLELMRLREIRLERRMSQFELGRRAGISQDNISAIERMLVRAPEGVAKRLALVLMVSVEKLEG